MPTTVQEGREHTSEQARWAQRSRLPSVVLAAVAGLFGFLALGELVAGSDVLLRLRGGSVPTTFTTAVAALSMCAGLLLASPTARRLCFGVTVVIGLLVLVEHLASVDLRFDQLVVSQEDLTPPGAAPGRPSAVTAVALTLLGSGGLVLTAGRRWAQLPAAAALVLGLASIFGHLFGVRDVIGSGGPDMMSLGAALMVTALALSLLLAVPGSALQWVLFGRDTGAELQRFVLPLVVVVVPLLGYGLMTGLEEGWFDPRGAAALITTFGVALAALIAGWVGVGSRRLDAERDELIREVRRVNQELEDRVRLRSHEVNRQRTKLALLEERDRIARDLHDRVIQRIFAAGLQVGALSRTVSKVAEGADASRLPAQLDVIAGELDLAIRELRNSIFQLTSIDDHQDLEQVVRDIATRSSRILGFMPRVHVEGDVDGVRSDLAADLASAIQEGLSNVARHARANAAEVSLTGTERELVVRIRDDGIGLPDPLPRSSGISNLINRARGLGGTATWEPAPEGGTIFTWSVARHGEAGEFYGNDLSVTTAE